MSVSCKIIEDLLPLYHDGVCSEESKLLVEQHLNNCETCTKYFELMSHESLNENIKVDTEEAKINAIKKLKKKLLRKNIMISLISMLGVVLILVAAFNLQIPIRYSENLIQMSSLDNNVLEFKFTGDDFYKCHYLQKTIEIDGKPKNILIYYYTNTAWTKFSPAQDFVSNSTNLFSPGNASMGWTLANWDHIQITNDMDAIYYGVGNFYHLNDAELIKLLDKATLLWEK